MLYNFNSHLDVVKHTLKGNADRALKAAKDTIVSAIQDKRLHGYSTPHGSKESVDCTVYAREGTAKLAGHPFIVDALIDETVQQAIEQALVDNLKQAFE